MIKVINFNTVEGWNINYSPVYSKNYEGRKSLYISPNLRYGFSNHHFNAHVTSGYNFGKKFINNVGVSFGKRVFQFNNEQPITERTNSYGSLWRTTNYMKIYEATFAKIGYTRAIGNGVTLNGYFEYQDRSSLDNLADIPTWNTVKDRAFTPNFPTEISNTNISNHKATTINFKVVFRPGTKYAELPDRTIALGSKMPTFSVNYHQAVKGLLGSNASYSKWNASISDKLNMKIGGRVDYKFEVGGFIKKDSIFLPDYQHIIGNQTAFASPYLNSYQLAPFYQYSNTSKFYSAAHVEYHLNGLISNKIPYFKKLNCFFVLGANSYYTNNTTAYHEVFVSIENIMKVIRVDFIKAFNAQAFQTTGIRISVPGIISGSRED